MDRNIPRTFPTRTLRRSDRCRTPGDPIEPRFEHSPRDLRGSAGEVGANRRGAGSGDTRTRASAQLHHQRHVHCVRDSPIHCSAIVRSPTDSRAAAISRRKLRKDGRRRVSSTADRRRFHSATAVESPLLLGEQSGGYATRSTRISISLRSITKSIGLVSSASAPLSKARRLVSASP
jgi:hypothetical protein